MPATGAGNTRQSSLRERELFNRLGWFINVRWVALIAMGAGLISSHKMYGASQELGLVLEFTLAVAAYNLGFAVVNRWLRRSPVRRHRRNVAFAAIQIAADLVALTGIVHWTGGCSSVFVIAYVFHMVIASELLPRWLSYAVAAFASILLNLTVLLEVHAVLQHHPVEGFTLGCSAQGYQMPDRASLICLFYNAAFFATVYISSSISRRLRQREAEVEEMNRQLVAVDKAKSEFLRMASHEMRAPLSAIEGLVGMALRKADESGGDSEARRFLRRGLERSKGVRRLIDDLLNYSRLQAPPAADEAARFDLRGVVAQVAEEFGPVAESKRIDLKLKTRFCEVRADPEQIHLLVKNLVDNALRYTPAGGRVEVRLAPRDGHAVLEVEDNGIGIGPESIDHVFDEFFRSTRAKDFEPDGTGLGLSMCRRIARRHGGDVTVVSRPGERTVFTARLDADGRER